MNPLVTTVLFTAAGAGAMALDAGALAPAPKHWWTLARDLLRGENGIAAVRGQTLDDIRATLQRRSVSAHGESTDHAGYPASDTQANLLQLCTRWLMAFPWRDSLSDTRIPPAYLAVVARRDVHQGAVNLGLDSTPALERQAYLTWRAVAELARAADAVRFAEIESGISGDNPDSLSDYIGLGGHRAYDVLKGPLIAGAKGVLFDPAIDAAEDVAKGAIPQLGLGVIVVGGLLLVGAYVAWQVIT